MADPVARALSVETPEAVVFTYPLAGLGSRGLAAVIDIVMLGLLLLAELLAVGLVVFVLGRVGVAIEVFSVWALALLILMLFATYWTYFIYGEVFRNGRTYGKRVMRIRVVRDDGSRVGVLDSVIRNLVRIIDLMPSTYAVGVVSMLLSPQAKRLGDMAAGTVVIAEPAAIEFTADLAEADARDALVREFLGRRSDLTPAARWQVAVELLAAYGETPQPGWDEPVTAGRLADLSGARPV